MRTLADKFKDKPLENIEFRASFHQTSTKKVTSKRKSDGEKIQ